LDETEVDASPAACKPWLVAGQRAESATRPVGDILSRCAEDITACASFRWRVGWLPCEPRWLSVGPARPARPVLAGAPLDAIVDACSQLGEVARSTLCCSRTRVEIVAEAWWQTREMCFRRRSVLNVERIAKCSIQCDALLKVETPNRVCNEVPLGQCHQAVAADDTGFRQSLIGSDFDLGANPSCRPGDRGTRHSREHLDGGVSGEHAHRPTTGGRTEFRPEDVASLYHSGTVSAASRAAARIRSGSCGIRR